MARTIILRQLTLTNFKGIKNLLISFEGNENIYGANEAGKSSIYTAYVWLLTGKDEFDRKDYEIKNTKVRELNSQAHEVEGIFEVDGVEMKLKRVYLEKWTKPKGQSQKVFSGHVTEFWVNDVPCSLGEYQAKVDAMIDPKIIKLVTNPTYFNSLNWDVQRRGLLDIAGEINDNDVFDAIATPKNDYGDLIMVLNCGKTLEEWKKELNAKKKLLKEKAAEYVPRIDEAKRNMPEAADWVALETQIAGIVAEIEKIDELIADASKAVAEKNKDVLVKQKQLNSKELALQQIKSKITSDVHAANQAGSSKIREVWDKIAGAQQVISNIEKVAKDNATNKAAYQSQIEAKQKRVAQLRADWDAINAERFQFDESLCQCPTCKQALPTEDIEKTKSDLQKNFNESVTRRKNDKVTESNQVKAEIKQLEQRIQAIDELGDPSVAISMEQNNLTALQNKLAELQKELKPKSPAELDAEVEALLKLNADALNLLDEIKILESEIEASKIPTESNGDHVSKKRELQITLDALRKQLAVKETIEKTKQRIDQLIKEEEINAQEIANLEQQEFQVEEFTRAKMDILQERVNSMFKYVKFRMFEKQVNGGIAETCVCEYNGVPYPTLNTAAKLLAGLDVLNTLSYHYQLYAPVFCDNRESVTFIPESKSQIISLFVSPQDKKIRTESGKMAMVA